MRAPDRLKPKPLSFNVTPLIDVTFLLIVFFVMTSRMITSETAMEMFLPRETTGKALEDDDQGKIVVNVPSADALYLGAKRVDLDELRRRLKEEKSRSQRRDAVRVRANRDVPYGAIEPILVICAQSGYSNVSFAVVEK